MKKIDLTGQQFGRLIVLSDTGKRRHRGIIWLCKCACGKLVEVLSSDLKSGNTKSCGCFQKEIAKKIMTTFRKNMKKPQFIHGDNCGGKQSRLYRIWHNMKSRCYNSNSINYKYYGDKKIKICKEWKNNYMMFKNWALANGYKKDLTIDRINNNKGYYPENCRWISLSENLKNKTGGKFV